jgi:molecular chaperone DnaK
MHAHVSFSSGTTNSAVAIMEGQNPKIIENSEGRRHSPASIMPVF